MPIKNEFKQKHTSAWKRVRNVFFEAKEGSQYYLRPNHSYLGIVNKTAKEVNIQVNSTVEDTELLKLILKDVAENFAFGKSKTNFTCIDEAFVYARDYGHRSVAAIGVTLLEYFLDPCNARFEEEISILDIGSGTGATTFGLLLFLDQYAKYNNIFRRKLKLIRIDLVEKNNYALQFCEKLFSQKETMFSNLPPIALASHKKDFVSFLDNNEGKRFDLVIASKVFSELECTKPPYAWNEYENLLEKILNRIVEIDGAFILIETPDQDSRNIINKTVRFSRELDFSVYSPCGDLKKCVPCWGWRSYLYLEPEEIIKMRGTDRLQEHFFSLIINKTEHHIWEDIAKDYARYENWSWEFLSVIQPETFTCMRPKPKYAQGYIPKEFRGRLLFSNQRKELWMFGVDFDRYWKEVQIQWPVQVKSGD